MKKVTTKVILLMLVIPLLLIFAINTTITVTSIMVDIPVTSVTIQGEKVLFVNVLDEDNQVNLNTIVTPKEATNKGVVYTVESVANEKVADVDVSSDGVIKPLSVGTVKVIATADGGRQDSVQINFYSESISDVEQLNNSFTIDVGGNGKISVGTDYSIYPTSAGGSVTYTANNNKVSVDRYTGEFVGLFAGEAIITAHIEGIKYNSSKHKFEDHIYELEFVVNVESSGSDNVLSFAGGNTTVETSTILGTKNIPFNYLGYDKLGQLSYRVNPEDLEHIKSINITYTGNGEGNIEVILNDDAPRKEYVIVLVVDGLDLGSVSLTKKTPSVTISTTKTVYPISNANITFGVNVEGLEDGYVVRYESTNTSVFYVNVKGNDCVAKARSEGIAQVKAIVYVDGEEFAVSEYVEFRVVNPYISLAIKEASKTYGLENRFVLGKYQYGNQVENSAYKMELVAATASGVVSAIDSTKVEWKTSDSSIATISSDGVISVVGNGLVTIIVESSYNDELGTNTRSSFEIMCRKNGLNVYDYDDLIFANDNNYETVLMNDVMLADGINASNYKDYLNNVVTIQMDTTADKSYYDNNNKSNEAKVRYCVEFTSNVYGNGYFIDGNNITRSVDKYNYSVFNGPLNFVALSYDNNSSNNAKIKAQDNIVFLVKKDGISLNNVELKGCSDSSLIEGNKTNLGKLDNCGTVLEIVGDNTSLLYSRVNNGRTVVRIYGKSHESDASKLKNNMHEYKTATTISNCILSYAREFILKVGSNQILRNESVSNDTLALPNTAPDKYDHAAPYFTKEDGSNYTTTGTKDDYFVNNYLMNDIVLKDSIFFGAGLFCIGVDTQFAGLVLHGYDYGSYEFSKLGWKNIAGTSYPVRIKMQGDVRFYDWKAIDDIDSSTMVEGDTKLLETVGLDLNISSLLNKFNKQNEGNKVIAVYEGKEFINGAIVFYGGGKNYSWIDTSEVSSEFNSMETFEVSLDYFSDRPELVYYAAGKENFRFMVYDNEASLSYQKQQNDLTDGTAYSWIIRK